MKENLRFIQYFATTLLGIVAFIFMYGGIQIGGISIVDEHRVLWKNTVLIIMAISFLLYVIFIIYQKENLSRLILICYICASFFAGLFYLLCRTGWIVKITSLQQLRDLIDKYDKLSAVIYILFQFLQVTILPIPGSLSVAVGVALFGSHLAFLYGFIGIFIGSIVAFAFGRYVGFQAVAWVVGKEQLQSWLKKIKGKDYLILSLMFLLPLFPDDMLCFVAGLSSMTWGYFVVMIMITRLLSVGSTAYSVALIPFDTWWGITIWIIITTFVVLLFYIVMKYADEIDNFLTKYKKKIKNKFK